MSERRDIGKGQSAAVEVHVELGGPNRGYLSLGWQWHAQPLASAGLGAYRRLLVSTFSCSPTTTTTCTISTSQPIQ
jgi:hypothetical protein